MTRLQRKLTIPKKIFNFIGGKFTDLPQNVTFFETFNPSTAAAICQVQSSSLADVQMAFENAKKGFKIWSEKSGAERGYVLRKTADLLKKYKNDLALFETMDQGKCISESLSVDIDSAAEAFEYFGSIAIDCLEGKMIPQDRISKGNFAYTLREPLGVVSGIGAWNYPLQIAAWKCAPALASGCAMIYKPSEHTPITTSFLGPVLSEAGLTDGVFNVVNGGADVGRMLSEHSGIAKISLTGSVKTGRAVLKSASESFKHVTMELGGKSPLIIFPDADIGKLNALKWIQTPYLPVKDEAVSAALLANFYTQGEICSNGTRIFVHEDIESEFTRKFVEKTERLKIGDPLDNSTDVLLFNCPVSDV